MHGSGGWMWGLIDVVGALLLAAGLIYGTMKWRHRSRDPAVEQVRDEATRRQYEP